jgi:3-oxoacyl-[acyl-carrier protein] reductase
VTALARYADLAGRRVLVTGASSGIGLGIAAALLEQGARVALQYRTQRAAVEPLCARFPGQAVAVQAELGEEQGCVRCVAEAVAALGGLDGLVHSAGLWNDGAIATLDAARLEEIFRVNCFSAFYLVRQAVAHLGQGPGRGSIVFIGSTAGQRGEAGHGHYAATKGALQSLAMSLAVELGPRTRVNVVSPGWVRTPMAEAALATVGPRITGVLPNRRVAEVDDVVQAVLFLSSEASGHLTGENLGVSGGALLVVPRGQIAPWPG